jgi:hypothetical protein
MQTVKIVLDKKLRRYGRQNSERRLRLYHFAPPHKKIPVVVLTRESAVDYLSTITVAPVSAWASGLPS